MALSAFALARPAHAERLRLVRPEPVKLRLWTAEPGLRLELYRTDEKPGEFQPLAACLESCTLFRRPGRYRLFVEGRPDSDVFSSFRDFKLKGPSDITVRPARTGPHYAGLVMGIVGIPMTFVGFLYFFGRTLGGGFDSQGEKIATLSVFGTGAALTATGWTLYGLSRRPRLGVSSLPGD